jgi:hypothetical protein
MSAELVNALEAEAHRLDAEGENAATTDQGSTEPMVKYELAQTLRNLAQRVQGKDPAQVAAEAEAGGTQSGLASERTDEQGRAVGPPDDADQ